MKNRFMLYSATVMACLFLFSACGVNKSQYETRKGKRKTKYYNSIQFD